VATGGGFRNVVYISYFFHLFPWVILENPWWMIWSESTDIGNTIEIKFDKTKKC
jgi:hypothetical protein